MTDSAMVFGVGPFQLRWRYDPRSDRIAAASMPRGYCLRRIVRGAVMRKARGRWALKFAAILLTPLLLGVTYKWVDPQGQVHFTDSPPREVSGTAGATPDDLRCVDALFQLEVLAGDWKVYKPGPGNDRTYLNDRDRPAEIERLSRERDANCSDEPDVLTSQKRRASELFEALSPGCREAREKLQNLQRPTAHSASSDIEKQQAYIAAHCPDASREGVWLADWIWVQRR